MAIIEIKDLSKSFKIYNDRAVTLKEKAMFSKRRSYKLLQVLDEIYLSIEKGEVVGLIGQNGSGKSTLLKLMTGILYPEKGSIKINGRVSSLLELGAGFHPDLSGRDNIYTNAAIFGLSKKETDARFQDIVDFSELHEFIDSPVRTYSSGMYMRLAFSVAINVDADILLIDEILAVGDSNFQTKCFSKLNALKKSGVTIVLVTHDLGTIEGFCHRAVWLNNGKIAKDGDRYVVANAYKRYMNDKMINLFNNGKDFDMDDIIYAYRFYLGRMPESDKPVKSYYNLCRNIKELTEILKGSNEFKVFAELKGLNKITSEELDNQFEEFRQDMRKKKTSETFYLESDNTSYDRYGSKKVEINRAVFLNKEGKETKVLLEGEPATLKIEFTLNEPVPGYIFGFEIHTIDGMHCYGTNTKLDHMSIHELQKNGTITCTIDNLCLSSGEYRLGVAAEDEYSEPLDYIRNYTTFNVVSEKKSVGIVTLDHEWNME
jgi:ABC-type polysaccharide/polyol phosphate transport system, ATPase component